MRGRDGTIETSEMKRAIALSSVFSVVAGALIIAFILGQPASAAPDRESMAAGSNGDFCGPRIARNFLQPLTKMASIHRLPGSGKLPFAPKGLVLEAKGGLAVGGGWVGYRFNDEAVGQIRRLNWNVSARLRKVNSRGAVLADLGLKQRRIESIRGSKIKDFLFQVSEEPAYYRVDISFKRSDGDRILGEYSNYVRVVRPRFDARLLMLGVVARQGEVLSVRLANFGTETLSSLSPDWRFAVHRYNGQEWIAAASNPPPERHKAIIRKLPAGQMDECILFRVPADEEPGLYRFSMDVERSLKRTKDRTVQVTAGFEVSGRSLK